MPEPEPEPRRPIDWRAWITLAWVVATGLLYGWAMIEAKAPRMAASIRAASPGSLEED